MSNKEKLHEAFGELLYVLAKADGIVQQEEVDALHEIVRSHPWAQEIEWSFDYELNHNNDIDYLYKRVMDICYENGPDPEYVFLTEVLEKLAAAHGGVSDSEREIINKFTTELTERFRKDIDKI